MSNNVNVWFPPTVRVDYVARALAILSGQKAIWERIGDDTWATHVRNCDVKTTNVPQMVDIRWTTSNGEKRSAYYHFEADGHIGFGGPQAGWRLFTMTSTPKNVALAKRLVDVFGGRVVYQDVGPKTFGRPDYKRPEYKYNAANDGSAWWKLQRHMLTIKVLTTEEIEVCDGKAGYSLIECEPHQQRGYEPIGISETA
jgi:hypothetical protein